MNSEQYSIIADSSHLSYKFQSIGPKGVIKKAVFYRELKYPNENYYNLSFGDWDEKSGSINDHINSSNDDSTKVLLTVAFTIFQFLDFFPYAIVLIVGSTRSRTRLYQINIGRHINEIENHFDLQGFRNGKWEIFRTGINYEGFLIKKK